MALDRIGMDENVLQRIQSEFVEMPGLRLTEWQARRLWGLDAVCCRAVLDALVDAKFLFRSRDGAFMRLEQAIPMTVAQTRQEHRRNTAL